MCFWCPSRPSSMACWKAQLSTAEYNVHEILCVGCKMASTGVSVWLMKSKVFDVSQLTRFWCVPVH